MKIWNKVALAALAKAAGYRCLVERERSIKI